MHTIPFLQDIVVIFGLSIAVLLLCHRIRVPSIVGFLLTGVVAGPYGLRLISEGQDVETLANIGIVLLLFTVGMEFSIRRLIQYKRFLLMGGLAQVGFTSFIATAIVYLFGRPFGESIFLGWLVALSSTAIVLRILEERGETVTPHGKVVLSLLIFQDIIVVPMVLLAPLLEGGGVMPEFSLLLIVGKGIFLLAAVVISAEFVVPRLLDYIARTGSRELFLLGVLTICSTVAWLTASLGVTLSLGAFLAGLIVSESEYSQEAIGDIVPFQDIFTSFFFVSMGMLLDVRFLVAYPMVVSVLAIGVLLLKSSVVWGVTLLLGMPIRTAVLTALALCQVGEFSFVLIRTGIEAGIGSEYHYQLFLAVSLLTMALTPFLISVAPLVACKVADIPLPPQLLFGLKPDMRKEEDKIDQHIVIVGMGVTGRSVAHVAREAKIPYRILEVNAEVVHDERRRGEPILFGDATHASVLRHVDIEKAKVFVVAINDPIAVTRIVKRARQLHPTLYIAARATYIQEVRLVYEAGADDVIADEFGTAIEIFSRVLKKYNVENEEIYHYVREVRSEGYDMHRLIYREPALFAPLAMTKGQVVSESYKLGSRSPAIGKSLRELDIRKRYGVNIAMIYRGDALLADLYASTCLEVHDILVFLGRKEAINELIGELRRNGD